MQQHSWISLIQYNVEWKKPDIRYYILYDTILIKTSLWWQKIEQLLPEVGEEGSIIGKEYDSASWGGKNVRYIEVGMIIYT